MNKSALASLAASAMFLGGAPAMGQVVTNPAWITQASPTMPSFAQAIAQEGDVSLTCVASTLGSLTDCVVDSERPEGLGFGDAALDSTAMALMRPKTVDGVATAARVTFTARFRLEDEPPAPAPYSGPMLSDEALALGRQMADRLPVRSEMPPPHRLRDPAQTARLERVYATQAPAISQGAKAVFSLAMARTLTISQMQANLTDGPVVLPDAETFEASVAYEAWAWAKDSERRLRAAWCAQADCPAMEAFGDP